MIASRVKTRILLVGLAMVSAAVLLGFVVNLFPDASWRVLNGARSVYARVVPPAVPLPEPSKRPVREMMPYADSDGYAVLSAWKPYWTQRYVIVVRREMAPDPHFSYLPPDLRCLPAEFRKEYGEAMQDFASRWPQQWTLEPRFTPAGEFIIVPNAQLPQIRPVDGVPANAAGYFAFSAVGFNRARDRAVLYVIHREGTFGHSQLPLMKRNRQGAWMLAGYGTCGWIT